MKTKERFSICVNPDEVIVVDIVAKRLGKSRSCLISDIIHEWIEDNAPHIQNIKEGRV